MLSIVIPAYNEEKRIDRTLRELMNIFKDAEIIVVFEGDDSTPEIVRKYPVVLEINKKRLGKGGSIQRGIELAKREKVLVIDADLPVPLERLKEIVNINSDLIIPYRVIIGMPFKRKFLHNSFKFLVKLFFPSLREFNDFQGGVKLINREKALKVLDELIMNDLLIDVNLIYAFKRRGFNVKEVAVEYIHDETNSKISKKLLKVILLMFLSLIKLRVYYSPFKWVIFTKTYLKVQNWILERLR
jgi:glycosyltransferase involved in cell wall biosynthesis